MGKTKKTTNTRAKAKAGTRRGRKTSKESAAASNEPRNYQEEMITTMAGIGYVPVNQLYDIFIINNYVEKCLLRSMS